MVVHLFCGLLGRTILGAFEASKPAPCGLLLPAGDGDLLLGDALSQLLISFRGLWVLLSQLEVDFLVGNALGDALLLLAGKTPPPLGLQNGAASVLASIPASYTNDRVQVSFVARFRP